MNSMFFLPQRYELASVYPITLAAFCILPLLILPAIKKISLNEFKSPDELLSIDDSLILRGIAAIIVMIHHYSLRIADPWKMCYFWYMGYIAVSIFFFLSGYAAFFQLKRKGDKFWNKYFFNRFIRLIFPYVVSNTIYSLFYLPTPIQYVKAMITFKQVRGDEPEWTIVWFLVAILIFTILFWLSFRFVKNEKIALAIFLIGSIVYIAVNIFVLHNEKYWFNSALAYFTGITYAMFKPAISKTIDRTKIILLPITAILTAAVFFITTKGYQHWIIQLFCSELVLTLIVLIDTCVELKSGILKKFGKASWEIFLIHPLVYSVYYSLFKDKYGFSGIICIVIGIIAGIILNMFDEFIFSKLIKKG